MVLACSITGLVIVLYVVTIVSFCFPQVVEVNAFSNFTVLDAFSFVLSISAAKRGGRVAKASGRESRGPGFDSRCRQLLRVTGP